MKWENINTDMRLSLDGLGFVFYSEGAVKDIPIGEDYLQKEYWEPQKVGEHIRRGDIIGLCTDGDADEYELRFRSGYPDVETSEKYPAHLRLAIEIMGNELNVIDLYWLTDWQNDCPKEQQIEIEPGFYHLTFCGEPPARAVENELSDEEYDEYIDKPRVIYVYLNRLETMPESKWKGGVPNIYWAYDEEGNKRI